MFFGHIVECFFYRQHLFSHLYCLFCLTDGPSQRQMTPPSIQQTPAEPLVPKTRKLRPKQFAYRSPPPPPVITEPTSQGLASNDILMALLAELKADRAQAEEDRKRAEADRARAELERAQERERAADAAKTLKGMVENQATLMRMVQDIQDSGRGEG
jgi:hypothetical protein